MNWTLTEGAAQLLERDEREAVLGDLAEAGEGAWRGLLEVLGLVSRRQVALWRSWRPWFAGFGLAMPCSFALMGISVSISLTGRHYFGANLQSPMASGGFDALGPLLFRGILLLASAWAGGFVVGSISRRTLWVSAALCLSPCLFCLERFRIESLSRYCLLLFLVPAWFGVRAGMRCLSMSRRIAMILASMVMLSMILLWRSSGVWVLDWVLLLPPLYLAFAPRRPNLC
jgi:hypothetical protein